MIKFNSETEIAEYLQKILISRATGEFVIDNEYIGLRKHFIENPATAELLPNFVRTNRDLSQFWNFIKYKYGTYQERREFIWAQFTPLFEFLEGKNTKPADPTITDGLKSFDEDGVHSVWMKALDRRNIDPEGAITISRTLLEAVCKHILDNKGIEYDRQRIELPELYKTTSKELNISPSQHTEEIFKQILGGVTSVIFGLGSLRNRLGDAHGQGKTPVKPSARHAQLAVNLAGATALFLIETWRSRDESPRKAG